MRKIYAIIMAISLAQSGYAQDPNFEWAKQMGGSSSDYGYGIATDVMGNVFTTGTFRGTADFDPGPGTYNLTSNDNNVEYFDIFIQKSDANGNFEWAKQIGGSDDAHGNSITTDAMGNVYTTGWFKETIDFDPGPDTYDLISNGDEDIFIQKIDADGNFMWAKQMGAGSADLGYSITTDADGNVYTTGQFYGTVDLDPGSGTYNLISNGASDIFIQKLDADGNFIWAKQMGAHSVDVGYSIATDAGGNVYTTGQFSSGFADFDPGPDTYNLPNGGFFSMFVQKLDTNGDFVWAKRMSDDLASNIAQYHIAADAIGNVYTTGNFQGTADFYTDSGTYSLTSNGSHDIFIQKLDTDGNFIWAKQMGRGGGDYGRSITTDAIGNVYTTGFFGGTVDFDPGPGTYELISNGSSDIFIQKLDADGNFMWAKQMGAGGHDRGRSITTDATGNVYTAGFFGGTVDFDPGADTSSLTSNGSYDIFALKLGQGCTLASGIDTQMVCDTYTWIDGNTYTQTNNTATFTIADGAASGCDSLVTLDLTINNVSDITTSVNDATITANNSNATYQWLDCDNNYALISGATNQNFTATMNGNYAVELTENGCTEISDCVLITTVSLFENENALTAKFVLHPNPTAGNFAIAFDKIQKHLTVRLFDISGHLIINQDFEQTNLIQLEIHHPDGIYILEILDSKGNKAVLKLLKE